MSDYINIYRPLGHDLNEEEQKLFNAKTQERITRASTARALQLMNIQTQKDNDEIKRTASEWRGNFLGLLLKNDNPLGETQEEAMESFRQLGVKALANKHASGRNNISENDLTWAYNLIKHRYPRTERQQNLYDSQGYISNFVADSQKMTQEEIDESYFALYSKIESLNIHGDQKVAILDTLTQAYKQINGEEIAIDIKNSLIIQNSVKNDVKNPAYKQLDVFKKRFEKITDNPIVTEGELLTLEAEFRGWVNGTLPEIIEEMGGNQSDLEWVANYATDMFNLNKGNLTSLQDINNKQLSMEINTNMESWVTDYETAIKDGKGLGTALNNILEQSNKLKEKIQNSYMERDIGYDHKQSLLNNVLTSYNAISDLHQNYIDAGEDAQAEAEQAVSDMARLLEISKTSVNRNFTESDNSSGNFLEFSNIKQNLANLAAGLIYNAQKKIEDIPNIADDTEKIQKFTLLSHNAVNNLISTYDKEMSQVLRLYQSGENANVIAEKMNTLWSEVWNKWLEKSTGDENLNHIKWYLFNAMDEDIPSSPHGTDFKAYGGEVYSSESKFFSSPTSLDVKVRDDILSVIKVDDKLFLNVEGNVFQELDPNTSFTINGIEYKSNEVINQYRIDSSKEYDVGQPLGLQNILTFNLGDWGDFMRPPRLITSGEEGEPTVETGSPKYDSYVLSWAKQNPPSIQEINLIGGVELLLNHYADQDPNKLTANDREDIISNTRKALIFVDAILKNEKDKNWKARRALYGGLSGNVGKMLKDAGLIADRKVETIRETLLNDPRAMDIMQKLYEIDPEAGKLTETLFIEEWNKNWLLDPTKFRAGSAIIREALATPFKNLIESAYTW